MAVNLKQMASVEDKIAPGHRMCPGCAEPVVVRQVLHAIEGPVVVANATGCLEVSTSIFPFTSWRVPWIHSAFENASTTIAGAETMYRSLVKQGKIEDNGTKFIAFGGDGATYDIGLQFISGVFERGHKILYVCLNNEAYMNTGIQRSSATPIGAWTTTSPVGKVRPGKREFRKNMTAIAVAHEIPFVAQASPQNWRDLITKVQRALEADGPSFINVLAPCPRGWRSEPSESISLSKLAVDTCVWPLYEVADGKWKLSYKPRVKRPVTDWLKSQGRFSHLLRPENEELVAKIQSKVDQEWEALLAKCEGA